MKTLDLSQDLAVQMLEYKDGDLFWKVSNSNRVKVGDKITSKSSYGYLRLSINNKRYFAHRVIYLMHHGHMPEMIDHIDTDISNNRIENLRAASASQNRCNVALRSNNTSGVKGVSWISKNNKWAARVSKDKKYVLCEEYDDLVSAVIAVRSARLQHHQSFANHGQ